MLEEKQFCLCARTGVSLKGQDYLGSVFEHFQLPVLVETGVARKDSSLPCAGGGRAMSQHRVVVCSSAIEGCPATQKATEKREKSKKPQNEPK